MKITHSAGFIDPRRIQFDPRYQRAYHKKFGMPKYLPAAEVLEVLPVILSRREDGTLWAIDGQHRITDALKLGLGLIPAYIIEGLTLEEEALLFAYINEGARRPQPGELHKALATGKEPTTVALEGMLYEEGVERKDGRLTVYDPYTTVTAIGDLRWVVNRSGMGLEHLRRTVRLLLRAWPGTPQLLSGMNLRATAVLLHHLDKQDIRMTDEEVTKVLSMAPLAYFKETALNLYHERQVDSGGHRLHALASIMEDWCQLSQSSRIYILNKLSVTS